MVGPGHVIRVHQIQHVRLPGRVRHDRAQQRLLRPDDDRNPGSHASPAPARLAGQVPATPSGDRPCHAAALCRIADTFSKLLACCHIMQECLARMC